MAKPNREHSCRSCQRPARVDVATPKWSWMPGLLVAILPKCPFCFLAFSSTIVVCADGGYQSASHTMNSGLTVGLAAIGCLVTLVMMLLNYRADRTPQALALAVSGAVAVMISVWFTGGIWLYYTGAAFMMAGVWLNGSLLYFLRRAKSGSSSRQADASPSYKGNNSVSII